MRKYRKEWAPFANLVGFVRLILSIDWDPLGLLGFPGALPQYDRYAPEICDLLINGATQDDISTHLYVIACERLGFDILKFDGLLDLNDETARKILIAYQNYLLSNRLVCA